jgi:hypothetical protein
VTVVCGWSVDPGTHVRECSGQVLVPLQARQHGFDASVAVTVRQGDDGGGGGQVCRQVLHAAVTGPVVDVGGA